MREITLVGLPYYALSVRQPWAWAIIHGGKDIENRSWQAVNQGLKRRGRVCIHASRGMIRAEYDEAAEFMAELGVQCPRAIDLLRGGIIGSVDVIDVVKQHESKWFFGPRGLVLANPEPSRFIPCTGQLGYFDWKEEVALAPPEPAKWMVPPSDSGLLTLL